MTETSRRQFLAYSFALLVAPLAAEAQAPAAPKAARVGVLFPSADSPAFRSYFEGFRRKMTELGYADGRNLTLLHHFGDDEKARLVTAAARLRELHPDVIVAIAPAAVEAASGTMQSIPIIAVDHGTDPIAAGYVKTLARPGGNLSGIFLDFPELAGKWLELLKTTTPALTRVALLWDPSTGPAQLNAARQAAAVLKLQVFPLEVRTHADFETAFRTAARQHATGVVALTSPIFNTGRRRIAELALNHRLPTVMPFPEYAKDGGLIAYGPDVVAMYGQAAILVGKVLGGTPVADIPVERPTRFIFSINVPAAKALGLTIPPSLLLRADQLIE
jgi:putative ABC transport system substrate-binding protein